MNEHLKPYRVFYKTKSVDVELNTVVYAADEEHARETAPQLFLGLFDMLTIAKVERIKEF